MNHKLFFPVDNQSVYFEKEHLRFDVENATHERVVERVQLKLKEALEANLEYKVH